MTAALTHARAAQLIGEAFHRYQIQSALRELHRSGGSIRIHRTHCRVVNGEAHMLDAWQVTIAVAGRVATVVMAHQGDAIANCLEAVNG